MEPYTYQTLGQGSNNIRLLQLLPDSPGSDIKCEIIHYTLRLERNHGLYGALSYVWGEAVKPRRILVNDTQEKKSRYLDVTSNLYAALQQLRDPDFPRLLWVDAICTSQRKVEWI
jgi:hypothetical protein